MSESVVAPNPTSTKQAPLAAGTWIGGSLGRMRGRGHTFMLELFKEYGDVVRFRLGPVKAMGVCRAFDVNGHCDLQRLNTNKLGRVAWVMVMTGRS